MPSLLLGLAGVSIPVIIHLLHRRQARPVRWGAMQFLRSSPIRTRRTRNIEQWILLALRILTIALLALVLARPRVARSRFLFATLPLAPADVAVVLDHSLSTGRLSGGKSVFERAVAETDVLLDRLKPNDTVSVILAEHAPRVLTQQPVRKVDRAAIDELDRQLHQQKPGMTDCSIPEAISAARRLVNAGRNNNKLILVLSDHQRLNWHINDDALWQATVGDREQSPPSPLAIYSLPIQPDTNVANLSIGDLSIQPAILGINRPAQITATIRNTGTKPMSATSARLVMNDRQIESKPVPPLAPKTAATVTFDLERPFSQPGSNWLAVEVNASDALTADNQVAAAANVVDQIPILIIDGQFTIAGDFTAARFLTAAMQPGDQSLIHAKVISISDALSAPLDDYMVVVVNDIPNLPPALRDRLAEYARTGHGLWFILGRRTQPGLIEHDLPAMGFFNADARGVLGAPNPSDAVIIKDPNNPMVSAIAGSERNALAGAVTRRWWSLHPSDADTQIVLAASNGDPLIMERPFGAGGGTIVLWATSADGSWNNWNLMPNFVPLVNETVYHLAQSQMHGQENRGLEAGQPIEWAAAAMTPLNSVKITRPDKTRIEVPAILNNGRRLVTFADTFLPGIYRLEAGPQGEHVYYGVNIDRRELDPTPLDSRDIEWLRHGKFIDGTIGTADLSSVLGRQGDTTELWALAGGVLLLIVLAETFMTYRLMRRQTGAEPQSASFTRRPAELVTGVGERR